MASVDPYQLLKALSILLNKDGSVRGGTELTKLLNLMKAARKLVSRCIYVNILRATTEKTILDKFVDAGGWEILNIWLQEAKDNENHPFILELIKLYKTLPVSVEILKKTNTAKIIKQFSKGDTNDRLKACSTELVDSWMTVIRGSGPVVEKPTVAKKKKVKKPAADPQKGKDVSETDSKETNNKRTSQESNEGNSQTLSDEKEGTSKKIKTEDEGQTVIVGEDSVSGGRTSPSSELDKLTNKDDKKEEAAKDDAEKGKATKDNKKTDVKKEEDKTGGKDKRKVKTRSGPAFAKFRSTGLESDAKLPPIKIKKKGDKITVKSELKLSLAGKREGPLLSKSLTPPEKKIKKDDILDKIEERRTSTGIRVKIIPPKPRLQESSGFLEALNAPVAPVRKKVKKTKSAANKEQSANSKGRPDGAKSDKSPASTPEDSKTDPPKFNFYSNAEPEEGKDDHSVFGEGAADGNEGEDKEKKTSKSNLKILPSKKKKSVTWKEDSELVNVCYFDLDENERENVNRPKDFRGAAQMEMRNEGQTMLNAMKANRAEEEDGNGGKVLETIPWRRPPKLDINPLVHYGSSSKEKDIQAKRERTVLQEIFFSAAMIPDTPKEPDLEAVEYQEPKRIPQEDETAPEPMETQPILPISHGFQMPGMPGIPQGGLPPRLANIVNQIPHQPAAAGAHPGGQDEPSMDKIKEILSTVMGNPNQPDVDIHSEDFTNKLRQIIAPFKGDLDEDPSQAPLLQTPAQGGPPPLLEALPPRAPQPHGYEPYPDHMGQYQEYEDYGGMPPPLEMGGEEGPYPGEEGPYPGYEGPNYDYPYPEERFAGRGFRFRGPRPPGPRFRGRGGEVRGAGEEVQALQRCATTSRLREAAVLASIVTSSIPVLPDPPEKVTEAVEDTRTTKMTTMMMMILMYSCGVSCNYYYKFEDQWYFRSPWWQDVLIPIHLKVLVSQYIFMTANEDR